jgi:energy-coupling factor transporter ATP-binding protein EcfA2
VGKALNLPPSAVLGGYLIIGSFIKSPASVKVPTTNWEEPVLIWLTIGMPTGSGKSTLFRHLYELLQHIRTLAGVTKDEPSWSMDDASFEKMGALMQENSSRLLGFYDELSAFLTQINLYRGRNISDSHELQFSCNCLMVIHGAETQASLYNTIS